MPKQRYCVEIQRQICAPRYPYLYIYSPCMDIYIYIIHVTNNFCLFFFLFLDMKNMKNRDDFCPALFSRWSQSFKPKGWYVCELQQFGLMSLPRGAMKFLIYIVDTVRDVDGCHGFWQWSRGNRGHTSMTGQSN